MTNETTTSESTKPNFFELDKEVNSSASSKQNPTNAFVGASWIAFLVGAVAFCIGLWNAEMLLNEKGYYFAILILGLFATVSVQKNVRDRIEEIPVSDIYYGISWVALLISVLLLVIGLWNAELDLSEKGF
ncbi:MAG: putative membrane protein YiaA, partial [Arenicella sp.]